MCPSAAGGDKAGDLAHHGPHIGPGDPDRNWKSTLISGATFTPAYSGKVQHRLRWHKMRATVTPGSWLKESHLSASFRGFESLVIQCINFSWEINQPVIRS